MATRDLNIKFKVDASDVTSGSKEAKDKVKDAANQMAQDVKSSSEKMEQSFKDVARSTDSIKDATKGATDSVKNMEQQVDASSKSMEANLESVSKKMSAMQAFRMGARGVQMVGGIAQSIAESYGATETANAIGFGKEIASNAAQGAAMGFAAAGPMGAVAGSLLGAADSLFKAGKDLQDAAKAQDQKAADDLEAARQDILAKRRQEEYSNENRAWIQNAGTEEGRQRIAEELASRQSRVDLLRARRDDLVMRAAADTDESHVFAYAEQMRALDASIEFAVERLNAIGPAVQAAEDALNKNFLDLIGTDRESTIEDEKKNRDLDLQNAQEALQEWSEKHKEAAALSEAEMKELADLQDAFDEAKRAVLNFVPVIEALERASKERDSENERISREASKNNAVVDAAVADKQKRERAAYIADLKSAWKADIDSGDFDSYNAAGADIKSQFDSAQKALDDFVAKVKKEMDDSGRNSTLEESETITELKNAVDSAQELLRAFSEVEKYAKDKEEKSLAGSQDKLNGGGLRTVSAPTDQLTRIGGGSGYASYNNSVSSVEQVQKSIDNSVKTLIANQNNQNNQIIDELRDIKLSNTDAKFG